ncbi:MAG: DUF4292 domain-containing protein [candidate division Zixibacteria bacterium]|nr:DUF4292 domain-containing protein [candidate division Zixibacteria bacterium]
MNLLRINNLGLRSILVVFGLAGFLVMGCAPKPKLPPEDRTPQKVLRCALENQLEFDTFACLMNLKLKGADAKFSGTIEFFYKRPDTFSFHPRTLFGMGTFKAGGTGDSLTIYFPKQNEFYSGSFADFERTGLWNCKIPLNLLLEMVVPEEGPVDEAARHLGKEKGRFVYGLEDETWAKEYWVDAQSCRLVRSQWKHKPDGEVYQIEYENFVTQDHAEFSKIVNIKSQTKGFARIKFLERKFNLSLSPKKFELRIPPHARRVVFESGEE